MRTIIEVPEEMVRNLDKIGNQQRKSRAAVIREAIQLYLGTKDLRNAEAAFGLWRRKPREGVAYQEQLRSEWGR